jgi:uncharacterized protein YegL
MTTRKFSVLFAVAAVFAMVIVSLSPLASVSAQNSGVRLDTMYARADIRNSYAITNVWATFVNPTGTAIEETFSFMIPENAFISNFSLTMKGHTFYATVLKAQDAAQQYAKAKAAGNSAGLLATQGRSTFTYSINIGAQSNLTVGLRYEEFIARTPEGFKYSFPLSSFKGWTIGTAKVLVELDYDRTILKPKTETYPNETEITFFNAAKGALFYYEKVGLNPVDDYKCAWDLADLDPNGSMLFYETDVEGYFFHVFSPPAGFVGGYMPKDIVFVLDDSGSMGGQKITQLKQAFTHIVNDLKSVDKFGIIVFNSRSEDLYGKLVDASSSNKADGVSKINAIRAGGSTNINSAMLGALNILSKSSGRIPMIFFLTDGCPTSGVTNTDTIRANVRSANTKGVRIYTLGFGYNVNFPFLKAMALENKGYGVRVNADGDAGKQMIGYYDRISSPLLSSIEISYSNGTYEVLPTSVNTLYAGSEVIICGKYPLGTKIIHFEATATTTKGQKVFSQNFTVNASQDNAFVAKYWAYAKIQDLIGRISIEQDATAKANFVTLATDLSLENGFVTPYTSLFVEIPKEFQAKKASDMSSNDMILPEKAASMAKSANAPGFEVAFLLPALALAALVISRRRKE